MNASSVCALCGVHEHLICGRTGIVCKSCLGKAISSILEARSSDSSRLTASDRCLLCGETAVSRGDYAAVRNPYSICASCMKDGLDASGSGGDSFLVAKF